MTERIERIIMVFMATLIGMLAVWFFYSNFRMNNYREEIITYQTQIDALEMESEQQAKRFDDSKKRANYEMQQVKDQTAKLLATKVPKDCKLAMDWGRRAAQAFR